MLVRVYPPMFSAWEGGDYGKVGRLMLHELCHGFITPIRKYFWWDTRKSEENLILRLEERQVQMVTYAMEALLPENWADPETLGLPTAMLVDGGGI